MHNGSSGRNDEIVVVRTVNEATWQQVVWMYESTRVELGMMDARVMQDGGLALRREVFENPALHAVGGVETMTMSADERRWLSLWLSQLALSES